MIYRIEDFYKNIEDLHGVKSEKDFLDLVESGLITDEILSTIFSGLRLELARNLRLNHISFLMGNGCSIYAGSKSTQEFCITDVIEKDTLDVLPSSIERMMSNRQLEEVLNALLTVQEFYHITMDEKESTVSKIIKKLKDHLLCNYVNSVKYDELLYHEALLLKLRSFGCLKKVNFYTLNYDLSLEYVLDKLSIDYDNGFFGFINRKFDSRTLQFSDKTKLVKIHGSVNWVYDITDQSIKETQPKFKNGKVEVEDAEHVLVYPTEQKIYQTYNAPYSELMRNMLNGFETGENLILVLGYKYGDEHINEILYKAVANPNNVFYFFDYSGGVSNFIQKMMELSNNTQNINIFLGSVLGDFTKFVKYLMPANAEKTDEERIFELLGKVLNHD